MHISTMLWETTTEARIRVALAAPMAGGGPVVFGSTSGNHIPGPATCNGLDKIAVRPNLRLL